MQTCTIETKSGDVFVLNAPNSVIAYKTEDRMSGGFEEVVIQLREVQESDLRLAPLELRAQLTKEGFQTSRMGVIHENLALLVGKSKTLEPIVFQNTDDGWIVVASSDMTWRAIVQAFTQKGSESLIPALSGETDDHDLLMEDLAEKAKRPKAKPKT